MAYEKFPPVFGEDFDTDKTTTMDLPVVREEDLSDRVSLLSRDIEVRTNDIIRESTDPRIRVNAEEVATKSRTLGEIASELEHQAETNAISGHPNYRAMKKDFNKRRSDHKGLREYMLMADIDKFKDFNTKYTHTIGDKVLKGVCDIIRDSLHRKSDILLRDSSNYHPHGEEMFVKYFSNNISDAAIVPERIRREVERRSEEVTGYKVTVSLGLTEVKSEDEVREALEDVKSRLSTYVTIAKNEGRNNLYYGGELDENGNLVDPLYNGKVRLIQITSKVENYAKRMVSSPINSIGKLAGTATSLYKALKRKKWIHTKLLKAN